MICPSCGIETNPFDEGHGRCFNCGRVLGDSILLRLEKRLNIQVRKWRFIDVTGTPHEVVALEWGGTIYHFGDNPEECLYSG